MTGASPRALVAARVPSIPIERFELACGARLLVSRRPGSPVCAVQVHVRGGHSLDPPGLEGQAYLAGRLVDQGTAEHTEEELATLLENVGGSLIGGSTGISGSAAKDHWELLLELLCECLTRPTYPKEKVARQKRRALDRLLVDLDDPRVQGAWLFRRTVYGKHWLGRPDYGSLESLAHVERRHLVRHHGKSWCGARALIAFSGDVEPREVARLFDRALASWPKGKDLPPPDTRFPARSPRCAVFRAKRNQVNVFFGHLGIRRSDPDYATLVVMDNVLGTGPGFTNRIARKLRDELGIAYHVDASIHGSAGVLPGLFTAYIGTAPEYVATAVEAFREELRRIQRELVGEDELELARRYLTGSLALGFERASRRATHMVSAERCGLPDDHLAALLRDFEAVTREDVRRVANAHLFPDSACLVASGPITKKELQGLLRTSS